MSRQHDECGYCGKLMTFWGRGYSCVNPECPTKAPGFQRGFSTAFEKPADRESRILREKADALIEHIRAQGGTGLRPVHTALLEASEAFVNQAVERALLAMNSIRHSVAPQAPAASAEQDPQSPSTVVHP